MENNNKNYFIKEGYVSREEVSYFHAFRNNDKWQKEVYEYAVNIFREKNYSKVLDIGCGSGFKLVKNFDKNETVGCDLPPTVELLKQKYPKRRWEAYSFDDIVEEEFDMIICSDVIEHILDPDELLNFIKRINFKQAIISTPERDLRRGKWHMGPPPQIKHIREWNKEEFGKYISCHFDIKEHVVLKGQVVVIEKKT